MVRYDNDAEIDFWLNHFDAQYASGKSDYEVFRYMCAHGTWPSPPVVVDATFAAELGAPKYIGNLYYLIEGTHRVSYLRRMIQRGSVSRESRVELIEVTKA
jgi:hypothetical protein